MLLQCAAGRDRCTEADEGSPPGKHTKTVADFIHTELIQPQKDSRSQILLTDLAYFLEVELWQGMEPVGQLSEVEEFHLKPEVEMHIRVNDEAWKGKDAK